MRKHCKAGLGFREAAVSRQDVIEVDIETIGVTLTPIGHYQELFVDKIEWGTRIVVKNNAGSGINCSYVVFAERKDTTKNIPEYQGLTPADYPGDNKEYVINGKTFA